MVTPLDLCQNVFAFPVPLSSGILPGSARYWGGPLHSGRGGPAVPGLRWQPERKGNSKQPCVCFFDRPLNTTGEVSS